MTRASFHALVADAHRRPRPARTSPGVGIVGRRSELDVVRRHLEGGQGLLLVTGEAGMGKTTLVETACARGAQDVVLVASGRCLPLSTEVPLLPVAEALRAGGCAPRAGGLVAAALERCPAYVREAMATVLPEWSTDDASDGGGRPVAAPAAVRGGRRAVPGTVDRAALRARAGGPPLGRRPDPGRRRAPAPAHGARAILGSWRTDDPEVSARVTGSGSDGCGGTPWSCHSDPLTEDETAAAGPARSDPAASAADAARIHARSRGPASVHRAARPRGGG